MTSLLTVLGAVLCFLTVSSEVVPQADFNLQGMTGKWYLIGFATNAEWFVSRRTSMKVGTAMLIPTPDGDLNMSYASLNTDGSCWRLNNLAKKTDLPGKFTYTSERWGNENDMSMVDVKYDEYALVHTIKSKRTDPTVVNKLYGRGIELSQDVRDKFKQFSLQTGVQSDNIVFLPKNEECPAAPV